MGLPSVKITFKVVALKALSRIDKGSVALILKGTVPETNPVIMTNIVDIPDGISAENETQIELAMLGFYVPETDSYLAPKKVVAYFLSENATDYSDAFEYFALKDCDYLAIPSVADDKMEDSVVDWLKEQRETEDNSTMKAVLPHKEADYEGVINFDMDSVTDGVNTYTAAQYCSRIAGLLAGTPLNASCTYAILPELTNCTKMTKKELSDAVDAGKLVLFWDGEKIKIARGVNSLTTVANTATEIYKKIRVVEAKDQMEHDIRRLCEDTYTGRVINSYDNKVLLMNDIMSYLNELITAGLLGRAEIDIDVDANRAYLKEKNIDVSELTDEEIRHYYTDDKVFLKITVLILDAMEEFVININIDQNQQA